MATTKTLTPTNQAITLTAFTDKPDNRTNVTNDDRLADAVNTLNSNFMTPVKINPTVENTNITIADNGSFMIGRMAFIAMRLQITGDVQAVQVVMTGFPVLYESTFGSGSSAIGVASNKKTFTMSAYGQLITGESLSASDTPIVINCAYVCKIN